jgi:FAD:protein FMN transferase
MTTTLVPDTEAPLVEQARFRVMGTDAHVIVVGATGLLERTRTRLDELEARWSRFRETSELSRLNAANGARVVVSPSTFALLVHARDAWLRTSGAFDPTVLRALEAAGYDRDFAVVERVSPTAPGDATPAPGFDGIELDRLVHSVRLPGGTTIDLGGIGKGFAADLVCQELLDAGAHGACVNLGGDLRVAGVPPSGDAWVIAVETEGEHDTRTPPLIQLVAGAVATTSRARRTWKRGATELHHIIDPRTGRPARTPWVSATVIAGQAVHAEPFAKAAFLAPDVASADDRLRSHGFAGLLFDGDGRAHHLGDVEPFLATYGASAEMVASD